MARHSGLQRSVLALYRECLRKIRAKPVESRENFRALAEGQFRDNALVDKKDFATIEHLLRRGHRQLEMYSDPGVRNVIP